MNVFPSTCLFQCPFTFNATLLIPYGVAGIGMSPMTPILATAVNKATKTRSGDIKRRGRVA
ncbi:hypothetical protein BPOR_0093g00060 [Botrytis porri]|uniref:Uncharacterized protein n=1 Tax=Botrytis porri TaxID=87229 RepID=A0A4Z1KYY3_9HELO|nr:hypothetical protein BPOR_0093g00060 [Botrytis porri]